MLRAQAHYISAKIAFLERRPWLLLLHLAAWLLLTLAARAGLPAANRHAEHA